MGRWSFHTLAHGFPVSIILISMDLKLTLSKVLHSN
jgi:hypothetical protein